MAIRETDLGGSVSLFRFLESPTKSCVVRVNSIVAVLPARSREKFYHTTYCDPSADSYLIPMLPSLLVTETLKTARLTPVATSWGRVGTTL